MSGALKGINSDPLGLLYRLMKYLVPSLLTAPDIEIDLVPLVPMDPSAFMG